MTATGNIQRLPRNSFRTRIGKALRKGKACHPARLAMLGGLAVLALSWAGLAPVGALAPASAAAAPASATAPAIKNASPVTGTYDLAAVACFSTSACIAVGRNAANQGVVVPTTGGTAGTAIVVPTTVDLLAVACASTTTCVATGKSTGNPTNGAVVTITSGVPATAQVVTGTAVLSGVACPTTTTCEAVGSNASNQGVLVSVNSGAVGAAVAVAGTVALNAIACSSTTTCEALAATPSGAAAVVTITGGTAAAPQVVSGVSLFGVACPTSSTCLAVGKNGLGVVVPITNGTPGAVQPVPDVQDLFGVACATPTLCRAVGDQGPSRGVVVNITPVSANAAQVVSGTYALFGMACPNTSFCEAVGTTTIPFQGIVVTVALLQGYQPVTPVRICDTRPASQFVAANRCQGPGGAGRTLGHGSISVPVAGFNGVPLTAFAVVLNVTVTNTTAASYLTVWPTGETQPTASNVNWNPGQTVPNLVEVALGNVPTVDVFNNTGTADVVIDLEGYVDATAPSLFNPLAPARICDSRAANAGSVAVNQCEFPGGGAATLGVGHIVVGVAGKGGVPLGATAAVLNVTVTNTTAAGFLDIWPDGAAAPVASNLNWAPRQTVANRVIVPLGAGGKIDVFNSAGLTDVVIDVNGYYSPAAGGSGYRPFVPFRDCDTRPVGPGVALNGCNDPASGTVGPLGPGDELTFNIPAGVTATVFNVTVTNTSDSSYLTVFPDPTPDVYTAPPLISDLNWAPGQTVANLVVVAAGPAQAVTFYNNTGTTDLVVDVEGDYGKAETAALAASATLRHASHRNGMGKRAAVA